MVTGLLFIYRVVYDMVMSKGRLTVVGLGYVGLPLAVLAKEKGWDVTGFDIDQRKIDLVNDGKSPLSDPELQTALSQHPITASTDPSIAAGSNVIVIAVPTPVTGHKLPDLKPLEGAIESLLPYMTNDQILVVESTINPGVMDEVVIPLLRTQAGLQLEVDGHTEGALVVAHCPERIN